MSNDSMFGTDVQKATYMATLNGLAQAEPKCYFTVFKGDSKIPSFETGTDQHEFIAGNFVKLFFSVKETSKGPAEKVNIILEGSAGETLLRTGFWNNAVRKLLSCFPENAEIGHLRLLTYNIDATYTDATGQQVDTVNKGIAVYHNGVKVKALMDKEAREKMIVRTKNNKGKVVDTDNSELNEYLKKIALTWKPQEAVRTPPADQAKSETPITDEIKQKQAEDDNDDLPF